MEIISVERALTLSRQTGQAATLPGNSIPLSDAYGVQEQVHMARGEAIAGWKIGLTGQGIRTALDAKEPAAGRLVAPDILRAPQAVAIRAGEYYIEGELIVELGAALPARSAPYTDEEVATAIAAVYVGFELVCSRFETTDLSLDWLIADNCMADRIILGDRVASGWSEDLADRAMILRGPGDALTEGSTTAVMGNPLHAVTWLANWLSARGTGLEAGHFVSSGTCTGVTAVAPGDRLSLELPGLGGATIEIRSE